MVKMNDKDIIDVHKGETAVICAHGPSSSEYISQVIKLQECQQIVRFGANNWFDFLNRNRWPDYWVLASNVDTVQNYFQIMNDSKSKVLFADSVDLTPRDWVEEVLECDYYPFDQRHFQGHSCLEILKNFKDHHTKNKNFNFAKYGNNTTMWQPPFSGTPGGVDIKSRCCNQRVKGRKTIQEMLKENTGHDQHYSAGSTVALHMIAFAIIMGFEKIYITGLDLDYNLGYANDSIAAPEDFWKNSPETRNLVNDLSILNDSAKKKGSEIINLNPDVWYGVFNQTDKIPIIAKTDIKITT